MLDFLTRTFDETCKALKLVKFDTHNPIHLGVMSLYCTIIEQTEDVIALQQAGKHATLDIILRSTLEAYVDLANLCNDKSYFDHMKAAYHKQWIKLAKHGVAGGNPYLKSYEENPAALELLKQHEAALDHLAATPPLSVFDCFRRADMEAVYRSVYSSLCNETHNNITALINRHWRSEGDGMKLVIFEEADARSLEPALSTFIGILVHGSIIIHDYFQSDARETVGLMAADHKAFFEHHAATMTAA